jgi:NUMOD4 motif/HNH endonuclease
MSQEEWRAVVGYEGFYEVSSRGRIRSLPRGKRPGRMRKLNRRKDGYLDIQLRVNNIISNQLVHRLVAAAFCPRQPHETIARHLNDERTDNRAENLAWGTLSDNTQDCLRNGLHPHAKKTQCRWGHPFDAVNTRRDGRGHRVCIECSRIVGRKWIAAKRQREREAAA